MSDARGAIARAIEPGIWDDLEYSIHVSPGWQFERERAKHQKAILERADAILAAIDAAGYAVVEKGMLLPLTDELIGAVMAWCRCAIRGELPDCSAEAKRMSDAQDAILAIGKD